MATLMLAGHPAGGNADSIGATSLSEWLQDDWAVLFSHPDDFVRCELEWDRWVTIAQSAFTAAHVRPLALATLEHPLDCGWVARLSGGACAVPLMREACISKPQTLAGRHFDFTDFHARRLQEDIEGMGERFVMIIDASLRRRRTYAYVAANTLPSPLDFVRWVRTLRDARVPHEPPADSRTDSPPVWPRRYWAGEFQGQTAA